MSSRDDEIRALYDARYERLAAFAYRWTGDPDASHEIAQEAFVRLIARWVFVRAPGGYLFKTTERLIYERWRRAAREARASAALPPRAMATEGPDYAVRDAVARLRRPLRDVVVLHYFADLSVDEIAAILRKPSGTVKWLLKEARDELRRTLGGA